MVPYVNANIMKVSDERGEEEWKNQNQTLRKLHKRIDTVLCKLVRVLVLAQFKGKNQIVRNPW